MAKYRIDSLADLARQLQFTPSLTRTAQVNAAEALLHTIDAAKAYPLDFITFRITGYRPKAISADQLAGAAIQHDLGLLIEQVSETLDLKTTDLAEPVLQIEDVTERFNVTSKTIQRWRRKGLPARRFIFPDGKRRIGFLISSVERFFVSQKDQIAGEPNFSVMDEDELQDVIRRARRLAVQCRCCETEICRRIARKLNRSPAVVLHLIRKHDVDEPADAIFVHAAKPLAEDERGKLARQVRRGGSIKMIARRSGRSRSAIYRLMMDERIARINRRKVKFIDDPIYHQNSAERMIESMTSAEDITAAEAQRLPPNLPSALASLCSAPLLSPARERAMFLKLNFHKMRFVAARRKLEPLFARAKDLAVLESHLRRITETRNEILRANLRLIVSVARKHLRHGLSIMELVSEGTMVVMRAIDSFDVHRGNKFSTYATYALMTGYARSVPQMLAKRAAGADPEFDAIEMPDRRHAAAAEKFLAREEVSHLLTRLSARERDVVRLHFGLDDHPAATYSQLASQFGVSKERVRQIERSAFVKLRSARF